jgi:hypothetical protein
MDCSALAPMIDAHADGEPSAEVEAHVAQCDACRRRLVDAQRLTTTLASGLAVPALSGARRRSVQHRVASEVRTQVRTRGGRPAPARLDDHRRRGVPLLAAAAALLAVAVPVTWWMRDRAPVETVPEPPPVVAAPLPQPVDLPEIESPPVPAAKPAGAAALALDREFAAAWKRDDFDAAADLIDRILAEHPGYVRVRYGTLAHFRIACDGRRHRWAEALDGSRRFVTTYPESPHLDYIRYFEVIYLARLGRFDEAVALQGRLLDQRPPSKYAGALRGLDRFIAQLRTAYAKSAITPR